MAEAKLTYTIIISGTSNQDEAWEEAFEFPRGPGQYWKEVLLDLLQEQLGEDVLVKGQKFEILYGDHEG